MPVSHSDIFCFWMVHSHSFPKIQKLSPKYCTPTRKTKHQWTDDSFLLNLSTLLPLLRESNLDLLRFASLPGKDRFVFFFSLSLNPSKPSKNPNQSGWASLHSTLSASLCPKQAIQTSQRCLWPAGPAAHSGINTYNCMMPARER